MTQYSVSDKKYSEFDFEHRYKCKVRDSGRYEEYFSVDHDFYSLNSVRHSGNYKTERRPILEISITRDGFNRLEGDLREIGIYKTDCFEYRALFAADQKRKLEEKNKRDKNPAAAKAYEKYLLLLNMTADSNGRT